MKIPLNPHITYTSPKGRNFRVIGIEKMHKTVRWIGRTKKYCWKITIKFLDDNTYADTYWNHNDKMFKIKKC